MTLAAVGPCALAACLLADPGGDLPRIPRRRPFIVQTGLVPSANAVLGSFPDKLIVPVELADPQSSFEYSVFLDYNPLTGQTLLFPVQRSTFERSNVENGLRVLEIPLATPPDLDRCHTIEVVVALQLQGPDAVNAHTPLEPGGDSVTWFYSPTGDLAGCPATDAGPDAAFVPRPDDAEGGPQ